MEKTNDRPSSSSEGKHKSIYLWFRKFDDGQRKLKTSTWYKLDPTQLNSKESELTLLSQCNLHQASSAVAWGSIIYAIGGNSRRRHVNPSGVPSYRKIQEEKLNRTREVYYLDTRCPSFGWKTGPALNSPRTKVEATEKSGDIYAFGGGELEHKKKWDKLTKRKRDDGWGPQQDPDPQDESYGEVLNPLLGNWMSITGPDPKTEYEAEQLRETQPYHPYGQGPQTEFDAAEAALGVRVASMYLYELDSDTWRPLIGEEKVNSGNLGAIKSNLIKGLGGMLVLPPVVKDYVYPEFIVDIGDGRLCLIWESERGLHCTKFRVSVHDDGNGVVSALGTVEAFRIFSNYEPKKLGRSGDKHLKQCLAL